MTNNTEELPIQQNDNNEQLPEVQQQQQQEGGEEDQQQPNANDQEEQQEEEVNMDVDDQQQEQPADNNENEDAAAEGDAAEQADGADGENHNSDAEDDDNGPAAADPFYGFEESEPNLEEKDMAQVLQFWESKHTTSGFDPVPILKRLAEIFEKEKEIYMRKDPDPFDERHPYRTDPSCQFGFLLKQLFRKDHFMKKLVNDYLRDNYFTRQSIQKSSYELNILALRLISHNAGPRNDCRVSGGI